jgi:hypothetical protein
MPRPLITATTRRLLPAGAAVRACEPAPRLSLLPRLGLLIAAWAFTPVAR